MKLLFRFVITIVSIFCICLSSCSSDSQSSHVREVFSYSEKSMIVKVPIRIEIAGGQGETDIYSWNLKKVGIEVTESIKGYKTEEELAPLFKYFKTGLKENSGTVTVTSVYKGDNGNVTGFADMKVYLPKKVAGLKITQKTGKVRVLDDLGCSLEIIGGSLDVEINSIDGCISSKVDSGSLRVSEGRLGSGTSIRTGRGNIKLKVDLEPSGSYDIRTGSGLVEINLPESLDVVINDQYQTEGNLAAGENPARMQVECDKGEIRISRY